MQGIVVTEEKFSFDTVSKKDDNILHNSNMLNLVSASKKITEAIEDLEAEIAKLRDLQTEIKTFASDEKNLQNTTGVSRLFDLAVGREPAKHNGRRW